MDAVDRSVGLVVARDVDDPTVLLPALFQVEPGVGVTSDDAANGLGPETSALVPDQPLTAPVFGDVTGVGHADTQTVTGDGQQRVSGVGRQQQLGGRFDMGHDIAQDHGQFPFIESRQQRVIGDLYYAEQILFHGRSRGLDGFLGKDLGDGAGIHGFVIAALADLRQGLQEFTVSLTEGDCRKGDTGVGHLRCQSLMVRLLATTVTEQDDMFDLGGGLVQHLIGGVHARIHRRASARVQGVDGVLDGFGVQGAAKLAGDEGTTVKADHANLVARPQQFDRGHGRLAGQMDRVSLHAARFVDQQDHGHRRLLLLFFVATGQRQDLLDGGLVVAPQPEAVVRTEHGQAAAEVRHVALHHLHLAGGQIGRRDVGEDQRVEGQQGLQAVGHAMGAANIHYQALLLQGPAEGAELSRLFVQDENTGLATDRDGTVEAVVDGKAVPSGDQFGTPVGGPGRRHLHVH